MSNTDKIKYIEHEQRETINGKPYFGEWIGHSITFNGAFYENWTEDDRAKRFMEILKSALPKHLEFRNESFIYRPPFDSFLATRTTIAIKGIIWGRAYEVMRLFKKGKTRFKKVYRCGKRKKVKM